MLRKGKRAGSLFTSGPARRFFISYFAPLVVGAILTAVMVRNNSYQPLPAVWLLLYGTAFVSSGAFSIRVIPIMGFCFILLGLLGSLGLPRRVGERGEVLPSAVPRARVEGG